MSVTFTCFPRARSSVHQVLSEVNITSLRSLCSSMPRSIVCHSRCSLPSTVSRIRIHYFFSKLTTRGQRLGYFYKIKTCSRCDPTIVPCVVSHTRFLATCAPCRPRISRKALQCVFRCRSVVARLANVSYAGTSVCSNTATTTRTVVVTVTSAGGGAHILLSRSLLPRIVGIIRACTGFGNIRVNLVPYLSKGASLGTLQTRITAKSITKILIPNVGGCKVVRSLANVTRTVRTRGNLFVICTSPSTLTIIGAPTR